MPRHSNGQGTCAFVANRHPVISNKTLDPAALICLACAHALRAAIRDFPKLDLPPPDIVLALHACDTATDEALAVGVSSGAQVIMSVPCCQKDIQRQFQRQQQLQQQRGSSSSDSERGPGAPQQQQVWQLFEPLLDHGILKQRQLDLLTDTFRAQLLRLAGYRWVWQWAQTAWMPECRISPVNDRHRGLFAPGAHVSLLCTTPQACTLPLRGTVMCGSLRVQVLVLCRCNHSNGLMLPHTNPALAS